VAKMAQMHVEIMPLHGQPLNHASRLDISTFSVRQIVLDVNF